MTARGAIRTAGVLAPAAIRARPFRAAAVFALALAAVAAAAPPAAAQATRLLVVTGVGGDQERSAQFHKWAQAAVGAATKHGVPAANVTYLSADQTGPAVKGRSSRDNVTKAIQDLASASGADDDIFIFLIGHGSFNGGEATFNLPGPDLSAEDYAKLLDAFKTQHIAFVHTGSSSGAFLPVLAGPNRTIVAATKTGGERNETRFPAFFVEALDTEEADRDRNGRISILEAFDYAKAKVQAAYEQGGQILTEHAALDDGSEGKFAATMFLAPPRSRTAEMANADPALRALVEERDALEREIAALQQRKGDMPEGEYTAQLEKLVTELALKSRAIRDLEAKK